MDEAGSGTTATAAETTTSVDASTTTTDREPLSLQLRQGRAPVLDVLNSEDTQIIPSGVLSQPVFVDTTGRRRRRIRGLVFVAGAAAVMYAALVGVSLAGGPIGPENLLPFTDAQPGVVPSTSVAPQIDGAGQPVVPSAGVSGTVTTRPDRPATTRAGTAPVATGTGAAPGAGAPPTTGTANPVETTPPPAETTPVQTPRVTQEPTSPQPSEGGGEGGGEEGGLLGNVPVIGDLVGGIFPDV
jgi:hypothetical protein